MRGHITRTEPYNPSVALSGRSFSNTTPGLKSWAILFSHFVALPRLSFHHAGRFDGAMVQRSIGALDTSVVPSLTCWTHN